jgi:hypothetical protein
MRHFEARDEGCEGFSDRKSKRNMVATRKLDGKELQVGRVRLPAAAAFISFISSLVLSNGCRQYRKKVLMKRVQGSVLQKAETLCSANAPPTTQSHSREQPTELYWGAYHQQRGPKIKSAAAANNGIP